MDTYAPFTIAFSGACHSGKTTSMLKIAKLLKHEPITHSEVIRELIPNGETIDSIRKDPAKYLDLQIKIISTKIEQETKAFASKNAVHFFDRSIYDSLFYYTFYVDKGPLSGNADLMAKYNAFYKVIRDVCKNSNYTSAFFFAPFKEIKENDTFRPEGLVHIQDTEYDMMKLLINERKGIFYNTRSDKYLIPDDHKCMSNFVEDIKTLRLEYEPNGVYYDIYPDSRFFTIENTIMNTYGAVISNYVMNSEYNSSILYVNTLEDKEVVDSINEDVLSAFYRNENLDRNDGLVSHGIGKFTKGAAMIIGSAPENKGTALKEDWLKPSLYFGESGKLLRKAIYSQRAGTSDYYITNLCKYATADNKVDTIDYNNDFGFVLREIEYIQPPIIYCLGNEVYEYLCEALSKVESINFYTIVKLYDPSFCARFDKPFTLEY